MSAPFVSEMDMDPEEYAALWAKRAANLVREKKEEQRKTLRLIIALVKAAGGEIRMSDIDLLAVNPDYELLQWEDQRSRETVYRVRAATRRPHGKPAGTAKGGA